MQLQAEQTLKELNPQMFQKLILANQCSYISTSRLIGKSRSCTIGSVVYKEVRMS